jgi:hypothetical protein
MDAEEQLAKDKTSKWLKAFGGFLASAVLAFLGFLTSNYLQQKEAREAKLKLYTELMSKREESDTTIREQMLSLMMKTFLTGTNGDLEQEVLGLELLAKNFHESIELSPLFRHVNKQIAENSDSPAKKADYLHRLEVVAKDVTGKQLEVLQEPGFVVQGAIDFAKLAESGSVEVICSYFPLHSEDPIVETPCPAGDASEVVPENKRLIRVQVLSPDLKKKHLLLRLLSNTNEQEKIDIVLTLDYFDFPMVNNVHLSHSQRCAVSLVDFGEDNADLALAYFPGSHASLRDKPYFDELVHDLVSPEVVEQPRKMPR